MVSTTDLETYVRLGDSLWANPAQAHRHLADSLIAASLRDVADERIVERAGTALLACIEQRGTAANSRDNSHRIADPFFRMLPEERFLLVALHQGRWSYARLARILDVTPERIEEMAWKARVNLASTARGTGKLSVSYPVGSQGMNCPEYNPRRPWSQKFLDEEYRSASERLFLQNHLMACASCRETLRRSRELYFAIEALMPGAAQAPGAESFVEELRRICRRSEAARLPDEASFLDSLVVFFQRREARWILIIGVILGLVLKIALDRAHIGFHV